MVDDNNIVDEGLFETNNSITDCFVIAILKHSEVVARGKFRPIICIIMRLGKEIIFVVQSSVYI